MCYIKFCFHTALKLDERNVLNVLHEAEFSDGDWEQLGQQLINRASLTTIRANRQRDSSLCMSDTIAQWLRDDADASWKNLAEAVAKVENYGKATAAVVQEKAGRVQTRMVTVFLASFPSLPLSSFDSAYCK